MANQENIRKWRDELTSGQKQQGKNHLHIIHPDGTEEFCCLGVACVLAKEAGTDLTISYVALVDGSRLVAYDGNVYVLPSAVREWLDIDENNPVLDNDISAAGWNDGDHLVEAVTFPEIAAMISDKYLNEGEKLWKTRPPGDLPRESLTRLSMNTASRTQQENVTAGCHCPGGLPMHCARQDCWYRNRRELK